MEYTRVLLTSMTSSKLGKFNRHFKEIRHGKTYDISEKELTILPLTNQSKSNSL